MTDQEFFNFFYCLIKQLSCLEKNNIAHRDLKFDNIMISNGFYKLIDFGEMVYK